MDNIANCLDLIPLSDQTLDDINDAVKNHQHDIMDTSPFNAEWFKPIRQANAKNSMLVNVWNGSQQQKDMLSKKLKGRVVTWGDEITKTKSDGPYRIIVDGVSHTTLSINKFAKQYNMNAASLRFSLWNNRLVKTKNKTVQVTKI